MADKIPLRILSVSGEPFIGEFQAGDTLGVIHGGTGTSSLVQLKDDLGLNSLALSADLEDIDPSLRAQLIVPSTGDSLVWNGTHWTTSGLQLESPLSSLTDVNITSVVNGETLVYFSSTGEWKNAVPISGGSAVDHGLLTGLGDDDHPQYVLSATNLALSSLVSSIEASTVALSSYIETNSGDHGLLTGLLDNDHPQYVLSSVFLASAIELSAQMELNEADILDIWEYLFTNAPYWGGDLSGVDHGVLSGLLDNDHPQYVLSATNQALSSLVTSVEGSTVDISSYIAANEGTWSTDNDTTDHTQLTNIGTNTHAQIDGHISDITKHFTVASIDHGSIAGLSDNDHPQYVLSSTNQALSSLVTSVEGSTVSLSSYIAANEAAWSSDNDVSTLSGLGDTFITGVQDGQIIQWDEGGQVWLNDHLDHTVAKVYNNTAAIIYRGDVVTITGAHNANTAYIDLARADSQSTMPAIGVAQADIAINGEGLVVTFGRAAGLNTSGMTEGGKVYVSPTTKGGITQTRPTATNHLVQNVGVVMKADATNGVIKVTGIGRSNDVDNVTLNNISTLSSLTASIETSTVDISAYIAANEAAWSTDNDTTDHTLLTNIGTNTHAQIDSHIADSTIHFTEASIDHGSIAGLSDNDHPQYVLSSTNQALSSLVTSVEGSTVSLSAYIAANEAQWATDVNPADHSALNFLDANDHPQYVLSSTNQALSSLVTSVEGSTVDISAYIAANETAWSTDNDTTDHTQLTNIGTNTHTDIDNHISDITKHFTVASIDHGSIAGLADNDHPQYVLSATNQALSSLVTSVEGSTVSLSSYIAANEGAWQTGGVTDHSALSGLDANDHPQYVLSATNSALSAQVDANTSAIDNALDLSDIVTYIEHGDLNGLGDNDHPQYVLSATNQALSSLVTSVEGSTVSLSSYIAANEGTWSTDTDTTDHTALTNIGTNTHAQIDSHIADSTIHFTEASIDHGSIAGLGDNDHPQYVLSSTNSALSAQVDSNTSAIDAALDLSDVSIEFESLVSSIHHGSLSGLTDNDHPQYVLSSTNQALSSLVTSIETSTVDISSYIAANEGSWSTGGATDLSTLGDTAISSPTNGQSLNWNGTAWVNSTPATGVTDHGLLTGLSDNDHPQYVLSSTNQALSSLVTSVEGSTVSLSSYIAANESTWSTDNDTTDHTQLTNIGTNTHTDIDNHISDITKHFTVASIDHGSIAGLSDNDHPQYVLSSTNSSLSSTVTSKVNKELVGHYIEPWEEGSGDQNYPLGWQANGTSALREYDTDPFNNQSIIWKAIDIDVASDAEGGFTSGKIPADVSSTYRFSCFIKQDNTATGTVFMGTYAYSSLAGGVSQNRVDVRAANGASGTGNDNPYFLQIVGMPSDDWYLAVAYLHPYQTETGLYSKRQETALYKVSTGEKISSNYITDRRFDDPTAIGIGIRAYHYYNPGGTGDTVRFFQPRIDVVDGNEPSISDILGIVPRKDYVLTSTNSALSSQVDANTADISNLGSASGNWNSTYGTVNSLSSTWEPETAAEILTKIKTVDGAGSNLDADLLDGQQGSYYLNTGGASQTKSGSLYVDRLLSRKSIDTWDWSYGDPSSVSEMPVLQGFTVKPKGYGDNGKGVEFRYDTIQTAYLLDEHSGATYNILEGSDPGEAAIKRFTRFTNQYFNLNSYKSGSNAWEIEFSGFTLGNSSNTSWKPLLLWHGSPGGNIGNITIEALEGDGTTWTTVFSGTMPTSQPDVIFPQNYYIISTGNLKGMRLRIENITNNCYLKMFGFTSRTSASFQWQMLKDGGTFYGDVDGKLDGVQEWYIQQDGDASFNTVSINGSPVISNTGAWTGSNLDHTTDLNNVGTNTHAQIDSHIADSSLHFTEASIDHGSIGGLSDNDHPQYVLSSTNQTLSSLVTSVEGSTVSLSSYIAANESTWSTDTDTTDHTALSNIGTNTHAQIDSHIADSTIHFTEASIDHTNISNVGTNTHAQIDSHIADGTVHFTEASIDHGSIAGLSDNDHPQYVLSSTNQALSSLVTSVEGSTVSLSSYIAANESTWSTDTDTTDHTALTNIGTNTHAQIDTHIADSTVHFTEGSIDHTNITNVGTNTHAQIDSHIADSTIHFTEASIDHGSIAGLADNDHPQYVLSSTNQALSSLVTSVEGSTVSLSSYIAANETTWATDTDTTDHTALTNIGTNTHAQIDTHIADSTIHFTEASIDHTNITNVGTNTHAQIDTHISNTNTSISNLTTSTVNLSGYIAANETTWATDTDTTDHTALTNIGTNTHAQIDSHIADSTIHFTEGSINHANITNVGTNTHAQIDTHIADGTVHFTEGSIDHTNITNIGTNTHAQIDTHISNHSTSATTWNGTYQTVFDNSGSWGGGGGVTDHGALTGLADNDHPQYVLSSTNLALSTLVQDTADVSSIFSGNITVTGTNPAHVGTIGTVDTATFGIQSNQNTSIVAPSIILSATTAYQFRKNGSTTYTDTDFPQSCRNWNSVYNTVSTTSGTWGGGGGGGVAAGITVVNTGTDNIDSAGALVPLDTTAGYPAYGSYATDYSYTAGNSYVTINTAGTYEVTFNVAYTSTVQRWNGILKIYKGTGGASPSSWIGYGAGKGGYLRSASGHNEASLTITCLVTCSANDTIGGWVEREAATGTCTLVANESFMTIKRMA